MPVKAHTWVEKIGPGNSSGSRSTCGMTPDSRMGAYAESARSDAPIQAPFASAGPLPTAVYNLTAGGLRFSPGALQHDVMMILCDPAMGARSEPNGASDIEGGGSNCHQPTVYRTFAHERRDGHGLVTDTSLSMMGHRRQRP